MPDPKLAGMQNIFAHAPGIPNPGDWTDIIGWTIMIVPEFGPPIVSQVCALTTRDSQAEICIPLIAYGTDSLISVISTVRGWLGILKNSEIRVPINYVEFRKPSRA